MELKFASQMILPVEEVPGEEAPVEMVTQHTQPGWLDQFKKNVAVEIEKCSARTRAAVGRNEKIEFFLYNLLIICINKF